MFRQIDVPTLTLVLGVRHSIQLGDKDSFFLCVPSDWILASPVLRYLLVSPAIEEDNSRE
jgi:hypothetical protein